MNMNDAQQQACPASAQPDKQVQHPAQQQRQTLRTITGLALLALAVFVTLSGRGVLC